jgi:hypothetical protein
LWNEFKDHLPPHLFSQSIASSDNGEARRNLHLATLDNELIRACKAAGGSIL